MKWLSKLGAAVKIGAGLIPGYGPLISSLIPGTKDDAIIARVSDTMADLGEIVKNAEIFGAALSLTGPDKLKASVPAMAQVILRSSIMAGQAPGDPVMFQEGVAEMTSALVKILNSRGD